MNVSLDTISALHTDPALVLPFRLRAASVQPPRHCLILLHGVRQNEMDIAPLAAQVDDDVLVVLVRARLTMGPQKFGFFNFDMLDDGPHPVAHEVEQSRLCLLRMVGQIQAHFGIAPDHTVIGGFSQGGILSACIALTAPESVAAFALLSARILPEIEPLIAPPARLAHLRAFVGHGDQDRMLPLSWAKRSQRLLTGFGIPHEHHVYPMEHVLGSAMQLDFLRWLNRVLKRD